MLARDGFVSLVVLGNAYFLARHVDSVVMSDFDNG